MYSLIVGFVGRDCFHVPDAVDSGTRPQDVDNLLPVALTVALEDSEQKQALILWIIPVDHIAFFDNRKVEICA